MTDEKKLRIKSNHGNKQKLPDQKKSDGDKLSIVLHLYTFKLTLIFYSSVHIRENVTKRKEQCEEAMGGGGKSKKWKSFQTVFLYKKSSLNRTIRYVEMFGVILFIVFGAKFFLPRFVFPSIFFLFQPGCCRWPNTFPLPLKNFPFYRQYRYVRSFIR